MTDYKIIEVNSENIKQYKPTCFLNPENQGYKIKEEWLKKQFKKGMKIKLLYFNGDKKCSGYIEYTTGEQAWRAVDAPGYMFIHCIWIYPNKNKKQGYGSMLVNECIEEAKSLGKTGVAVITSEDSFRPSEDIFLKNGFISVEKVSPSYDLLIRQTHKGPIPKFKDWQKKLKSYKGLNILYSKQCPWVIRFMEDLKNMKNKPRIKIKEMKTAKEAQNAPSVYSSFNFINNGKLLADHYISMTRFNNILKKEVK